MFFYIDRIESELKRILCFWQNNVLSGNSIFREVSTDGSANTEAPVGNVFLSGIIYGASVLTRFLNVDSPLNLAQLAYNEQQLSLANPNGGYYFGRSSDSKIIHEGYDIGYTQAYVLLGLIEYFKTTNSNTALNEITQLIDFIEVTFTDDQYGGYLEGFDVNWNRYSETKKSLATHLRIMEAYASYYQISADKKILTRLEEIIDLLISKFFNDRDLNLQLEFSQNWQFSSKKNNMGLTAETSWLIYKCAKITKNTSLIELSAQVAVQLAGYLIEFAFDNHYGGVFSKLTEYQTPENTSKEWWVQTEATLAFLNSFEITDDKVYLNYAARLFEYIDCVFSDEENGEWHDSITREGLPIASIPKIHFSKSMHHIIRYCIESHKRFKHLAQTMSITK